MDKFLLSTFFFIAATINSHAQQNKPLPDTITKQVIYQNIYDKLKEELGEYCKPEIQIEAEKANRPLTAKETKKINDRKASIKVVNDKSFSKQSKIIFNTVVTSNKDAVNNGSAFGYSQDKDKHKFSANMTFASKKWKYSLIEVGTSISGTDDNFKYYTKGKWANDVSLKIGYNLRLTTSHFSTDTSCNRLSQLRQIAIREKLSKIKDAVKLNYTSVELEKIIKKKNERQYESLKYDSVTNANYKKQADELYNNLVLIKEIENIMDTSNKKEGSEIRQITKDLFWYKKNVLNSLVGTTEKDKKDAIVIKQINDYVDQLLSEFDEKNIPFHGYRVTWLNANANISNSALSIKGDTLMVEDIQDIYTGRMKSNIEFSWNLSHVSLKTIQYAKVYTSLNQISFLDSPNLIDLPLMVAPNQADLVSYYNIVDDKNNIIDRYDQIREWKYSLDIGGIYSNLFLFDKTLGFIVRANLNVPAFHNIGMIYDRNYTLLAGPVFRVASKSEWSSATFTINAGVENQLVDDGDWGNRFVVKASVGIPFTIFEKSKPEPK